MMKECGHTVYLYAGEQNEAPCHELVPCISEVERSAVVGNGHYVNASFDISLPHWKAFNANAARAIAERAQPHDFLCLIAGQSHKPIADALPALMAVEFGIGYGGTFARYRVWESYAWMHVCYGASTSNSHSADGQWFDAVIPNSFEVEDFPFRECKDDYYLFIGRLIDRKGVQIAADACEAAGRRLIIAGYGTPPGYGEYIGIVGPQERGRLMAGARAVLAPTVYIEPFGGVVVEAMMCGTPVITTDWGAFTETNIHGVTGFRCRMFHEFASALDQVNNLDPKAIRDHAIANYSLDAIGPKYDAYFRRLETLWKDGWYQRIYGDKPGKVVMPDTKPTAATPLPIPGEPGGAVHSHA